MRLAWRLAYIESVVLSYPSNPPSQITGDITTGARPEDLLRFLDHHVCLWSSSDSASTTNSSLTGKHQWPFSVNLPKEVTLEGSGASGPSFRLPHTLMDRNVPVGVNYHIAIKVSRRRFHADSKLVTMVSFYTVTRPDPASLLRQQSYRDEQHVLGPEKDPAGWHRCDPVNLRGRLFDNRIAEVQCTLSVALPLCFTRGTAIPLFISITSHDRQALDLLASPGCIKVQLHRHMRYADISSFNSRGGGGGKQPQPKSIVTECGSAFWWPTKGLNDTYNAQTDWGSKTFAGELRLSKFSLPSCETPYLAITYILSLQPFHQVVGFRPTSEDLNAALIEVPLSIATLPAKGPPARCYSPPSYSETTVGRERAKMPGVGASAIWQATRSMPERLF